MRVTLKRISIVPTYGKKFGDFDIGRGFEDTMGDVRVRLDTEHYVHVNNGYFETNHKNNWPEPSEPVVIKKYKITMEEL